MTDKELIETIRHELERYRARDDAPVSYLTDYLLYDDNLERLLNLAELAEDVFAEDDPAAE